MKYLFILAGIVITVACSVPPQTSFPVQTTPTPAVPASQVIIIPAPGVEVKTEKIHSEKPQPKKQNKLISDPLNPCAGIDTSDPTDDVRSKLNCLDKTLTK